MLTGGERFDAVGPVLHEGLRHALALAPALVVTTSFGLTPLSSTCPAHGWPLSRWS